MSDKITNVLDPRSHMGIMFPAGAIFFRSSHCLELENFPSANFTCGVSDQTCRIHKCQAISRGHHVSDAIYRSSCFQIYFCQSIPPFARYSLIFHGNPNGIFRLIKEISKYKLLSLYLHLYLYIVVGDAQLIGG